MRPDSATKALRAILTVNFPLRQSPLLTLFSLLISILLITAPSVQAQTRIRLATTTSTQNSGLLDDLLPRFETATGSRVDVIAVGTGKALRLGEAGDVDLVMVHAPEAELSYVRKGVFTRREAVMHNRFVLLGPAGPSPGGGAPVSRMLAAIATAKRPFVSRGDNSGTHKKELKLWAEAGIRPAGKWYREVGQGMGKTLIIASEQGAFTLADEATFYAFKSRLDLVEHSRPEKALHNPYSVMALNAERYPKLNHKGAKALIDWLISRAGQTAIGNYSRNGRRLFTPDRLKP